MHPLSSLQRIKIVPTPTHPELAHVGTLPQHSRNQSKSVGSLERVKRIEPTSSAWEADDRVACTPATVSRAWDDEPTPLRWREAGGHRWLAMLESGEVKALWGTKRVLYEAFFRLALLVSKLATVVLFVCPQTAPAEERLFSEPNTRESVWI